MKLKMQLKCVNFVLVVTKMVTFVTSQTELDYSTNSSVNEILQTNYAGGGGDPTSIIEEDNNSTSSNSTDDGIRDDHSTRDKFVSSPSSIILEHVDFVSLRLRHILNQTTTNITELRLLQEIEFQQNEVYREGWAYASRIFNESTRQILMSAYPNDSIVHNVPDEYHIALVGYSMQYPNPALYQDFNEKTRELCSGKDIVAFQYKSYFKLLELAVETLGNVLKLNIHSSPPKTPIRFLYRGISKTFSIKEGQLLAFQHFISTSVLQTVAEAFSGGGTVFEFDGQQLGAYMGLHSVYSGEEEVLLSPLQVFSVDSIHQGNYYVRYVLKSRPISLDGCNTPCSNKEDLRDHDDKNDMIQTLGSVVTTLGIVLGVVVITSLGGFITVFYLSRRNMFYKRENVSELQLT